MSTIPITKRGAEKLKEELQRLKHVERPAVVQAIADSRSIRQAALANRITYYTTMAGCEAAVEALKHQDDLVVYSVQEMHAKLH